MKKIYTLTLLILLNFSLFAQSNDPKSICYVEVNNNNISNVGSYKLAQSNKQLFDVAIIFAANINYDSEKQRTYLYNNNNVSKVLNNNATYISSLQNKGIKVLLSVLGNHQGTGICNLPDQEAIHDFAMQLAYTVEEYGLDGIDFDDEYAGYGNNSTNAENNFSFVLLLEELRNLMPEKLITFYYYGPAVTRQYYNQKFAGNYLNYSWNAIYGTFSAPFVYPLTIDNLSAAAAWINNSTNSQLVNMANNTINQDYGLFLWYDLHGYNESSYLSTGTQILYGENTILTETIQSWTQGGNCDAPIGLTSTYLSNNSVTLSWNTVGNNTYKIDYKKVSDNIWTNVADNLASTSIVVSNLESDTDYVWRIRTNCTVTSTYIFAPIFNLSELKNKEISDDQTINVYPNPIKQGDKISIAFKELKIPSTFELYNSEGRLILSQKIEEKQQKIDTKNLLKGVYFFQISNTKNKGKLIVN